MKRPLFLLLTFAFFHSLAIAQKVDETIEPATTYSLMVNGKAYEIKAGKELLLKGDFKNPSVTLVPSKEKLFTYGGIKFKYPANYSFEADLSDEVNIWTLDGNDMVLMYYVIPERKLSTKEVAESIATEYKNDARITAQQITLNGVKYNGFKINVNLANVKLSQFVITLPSKESTKAFVIQDLSTEEKLNENEAEFTMKLLNESLKAN